jgi:hypothetical protein
MEVSRYLTRWILVVIAVTSIFTMIWLPGILARYFQLWQRDDLAFPLITLWEVRFVNAPLLRYFMTGLMVLAALVAEFRIQNRKLAGTILMLILICTMIIGYAQLLAALMPMMPLQE